MQEIKDISVLTNHLSFKKTCKDSQNQLALAFLDELGINTSIEQGLPLMWSICEYFMSLSNTGLIVATHNHFLNHLSETYSSVKILKMNDKHQLELSKKT
jgi:hypothetical protein